MTLYTTVFHEATSEQVIEKSRFISLIAPVNSKEEADAFFARIRDRYKDATHVVPAFILGKKQEIKWMSDDGEPQGTAGAPILSLLEKEGLTYVACAVVRYFGGRLLGTGGLVHAYGSSAKLALEASGKATMEELVSYPVTFAYPFLSKLQNREKEGTFTLTNMAFTEVISAEIICTPEKEEVVRNLLTELTAGSAVFGNRKTFQSLQKSR